ncbi:MAG: outer membrane beta-barrel family protein, partial [Prevotellaceae bacterium]|nr:outer membrane beta-barrel family protein [Prevotellaceae bacterium]
MTDNVDYQHSFSVKNRLLTASYLFNSSYNDVRSDNMITGNINFGDDHNKQNSDGSNNEHTFQIDYTTPVHKIHTVETGIKYIKRFNESNSSLSRLFG